MLYIHKGINVMNDKFFTIKEIADILRINERSVVKLINNGQLKAVNVGTSKRKMYRIFDGQFQNFIAEHY